MCPRVYAKHPCTQLSFSQGLAVGHIHRYPLHHYNRPAFMLARTELIVTQIANGRINHPTN